MAEDSTAVQAPATEESPYQIKIEDGGPATKKVSVEIPQQVITERLEKQFKDLRREAALPGFRPGHAPQKLVEKRFHGDVRDQVCRTLISESYEQAVKQNSLQVIGEPEFDTKEEIKLPETGNLTYSFQIEVQPQINLPVLTGLKVRKPRANVSDEHIDHAIEALRGERGALVPVEDRGVEAGDHLIADLHLLVDGNVISHEHDSELQAKPSKIGNIRIEDLPKQLEGMRPGEKRNITVHVPDTDTDEQIRGKDVTVEVALKDIKKLELAEMNQEFLENLGFADEASLRDALRQQMERRLKYEVQEAMRMQIEQYLYQTVQIDLPEKLSEKQVDRVTQRRSLDLMMRGIPREKVDLEIEKMRASIKDLALRDLKVFFILQQVAAQQNVNVDEPELNGRISLLAAQAGTRPEKLKQQMSADGSLVDLFVRMREQKALDKILETAVVEEVDVPLEEKQD